MKETQWKCWIIINIYKKEEIEIADEKQIASLEENLVTSAN